MRSLVQHRELQQATSLKTLDLASRARYTQRMLTQLTVLFSRMHAWLCLRGHMHRWQVLGLEFPALPRYISAANSVHGT